MMITRLELDGFKTFQDFKIELAPFQVIIGPNGAGKSNLFDALRLLSKLAGSDLGSTFSELRGEANELFTLLPEGRSTDRMRLAVEILVDRQIQDDWGTQKLLKYTRLRYELEIARRADERGLERLYITHELLEPIPRRDDAWANHYLGGAYRESWIPSQALEPRQPFFYTEIESDQTKIHFYDENGEQKRDFGGVTHKMKRTILSGVTNVDAPYAFAAAEEMRAWQTLHLNPETLRQPYQALLLTPEQPVLGPDGSHLSGVLARMEAEDPFLLNDVSRDLANLAPGIVEIGVEKDETHNQYLIRAKTQDGRSFSSQLLSDGTLRLLVLATLKNDPQYGGGVLCLEEPENGIHPFRLKNLVELLRDLTTDFSDPTQAGEPLRQLLINTHSPVLVSQPAILPGLLFAHQATRIQPGQMSSPRQVTRMTPVKASQEFKKALDITTQEEAYTVDQVMEYLDSADPVGAKSDLRGHNNQ